ncbi:MAG: hypothetical protein F6K16_26860 [Symploca sp. SIO2B6]|nr:hypothetical protein [Symploca sp. SIO2B6]
MIHNLASYLFFGTWQRGNVKLDNLSFELENREQEKATLAKSLLAE